MKNSKIQRKLTGKKFIKGVNRANNFKKMKKKKTVQRNRKNVKKSKENKASPKLPTIQKIKKKQGKIVNKKNQHMEIQKEHGQKFKNGGKQENKF